MEITQKSSNTIKQNATLEVKGFETENGDYLSSIRIFYHTWGNLNAARNNVIWLCHGLTANSDAENWWPGIIGPGKAFDTDRYFVICPNMPGSCYGSSTPEDLKRARISQTETNLNITVRDIAVMYDQLAQKLAITGIEALVGPSIGGFVAFEWALNHTIPIQSLMLIASSYYASPWNIAINETQRMGLNAGNDTAGLAAARAIAMLSYRTRSAYNRTQPGKNDQGDFLAATYQQYQGAKLTKRFSKSSYEFMIDLFNSHDISRGKDSYKHVFSTLNVPVLIIGFSHDQLFPVSEQLYMHSVLSQSMFHEVDSDFGHDAFLTETQAVSQLIQDYLNQ